MPGTVRGDATGAWSEGGEVPRGHRWCAGGLRSESKEAVKLAPGQCVHKLVSFPGEMCEVNVEVV